MTYLIIAQFFSLLLDLFAIRRRSARYKDLQILLPRPQLRIPQRQHPSAPRISR